MTSKISAVLERVRAFLDEQESQQVQKYAAMAAAASALATEPEKRKKLARMADYWGHQGDALAHAERIAKAIKKQRKQVKKGR